MNLQQLRILRETIRCKFNVTEAANAIYASQSGVSKQIRDLEDELGVSLFQRKGKRLLGLTEIGEQVVKIADRLLLEADNIKQAASQFSVSDRGILEIATTHTQARYALPEIILKFKTLYPNVRLVLRQTNPRDIAAQLADGSADIGIATDVFGEAEDVLSFPYYTWQHVVVAPSDHPLANKDNVSFEDIAEHPVITYETGLTGRPRIDQAFEECNAVPDVVMTALDADIIKTYAQMGLGLGIIAPMAFDPEKETGLKALKLATPFAPSVTSIALRRGRLHRGYVYRFLELCNPSVTERAIRDAEAQRDRAGQ